MSQRRLGFAFVLLSLGLACRPSAQVDGTPDCPEPAVAAASESEAEDGERIYTALDGLDHGLIQSPVNILSLKAAEGHHQVEFQADKRGVESVINKGHTIELELPKGATITFDGQAYEVAQTHFHTPSEHQIDGMTYPMEMHIVSTAPPETDDGPTRYLVIGLLFRMGEPSPFIQKVIESVPTHEGEEAKAGPLYITDLVGAEDDKVKEALGDFFHYRGSLTTPPYTESVQWLVVKRHFEASPEQIMRINAIEGDNARHIQMMFGRSVD